MNEHRRAQSQSPRNRKRRQAQAARRSPHRHRSHCKANKKYSCNYDTITTGICPGYIVNRRRRQSQDEAGAGNPRKLVYEMKWRPGLAQDQPIRSVDPEFIEALHRYKRHTMPAADTRWGNTSSSTTQAASVIVAVPFDSNVVVSPLKARNDTNESSFHVFPPRRRPLLGPHGRRGPRHLYVLVRHRKSVQ
jgi:hypothetical protein